MKRYNIVFAVAFLVPIPAAAVDYYVNDSSTTNDVYCTAVGSDANDGLTPATAKASVQAVLDAYDLEPGDAVYVDTGTYVLTENITVDSLDSGASGDPVTFQGSTHPDGTTLDRNDTSSSSCRGISIGASYVRVQDIRVTGSYYGIYVAGTDCEVRGCELFENTMGLMVGGRSTVLVNNLIHDNTSAGMYFAVYEGAYNPVVVNNTVVGNGDYGVRFAYSILSDAASFKNNVVRADGAGNCCVYFSASIHTGCTWDYNDLHATGGASVGYYGSASRATLGEWREATGKDSISISEDPLFVDEVSGDYHLSSTGGSWHGGAWAADGMSSPCIDAGDPASGYSNESSPNGGRVNLGAYGNTDQASKTPNRRFLTLLEPVGGENWASGDQSIRWRRTGGAWDGAETVRIYYSSDAGHSWTLLIDSLTASDESFTWNVDGLWSSPFYRVRIRCAEDASATDESADFRIGSATCYYVNDNSQINDVYCTTVGNDANDGLSPATPKGSIQAILDAYDLEPGHRVYVDTGTYLLATNIVVDAGDAGASGDLVTLIGSTHSDGTTVDRANTSSSAYGLEITGGNVRVSELRVTNAYCGVYLSGTGSEVTGCELFENIHGLFITSSSPWSAQTVANNLIRDNVEHGIYSWANSSPTIINNTIANNSSCGIYLEYGLANDGTFKNNIVSADDSGLYCVFFHNSLAPGFGWDYNDLYATGGAAVGYFGGTRATLSDWQTATSKDAHSISQDPLFVDAALNDYHLRTSSPCVDAGDNNGAPSFDMDGNSRPFGTSVDIGADEANNPSTPVVVVTPVAPTTVDNLLCTITTPTIVSPELTPQYEYSWSNGIDTVIHGPTTNETDTLSASFTAKHQTWLCTVRGFDGFSYSEPAADSTTVLNTPHDALSLSIPETLSTNLNLQCQLIKSPDPDNDVEYLIQWVITRPSQGWVDEPWTGPVLTTDTYTQIDTADTQNGDKWYCEVTYGDGEEADDTETSGTCTIGPTIPSFISLGFDGPNLVTLGDFITVKGVITPPPASGTIVSFESTSPSAVVDSDFPEAVAIGGSTYSRTFYPDEASEGRDPWKLTASWPGDDTHMPSTSDEVAFTVNKAQSALSLELSHSSALVNLGNAESFTATATLSVDNFPTQLRPLLLGRTIRLSVATPEGQTPYDPLEKSTDSDGVATFTAQQFEDAGILFGETGVWKFKAEFTGDDNFTLASTPDYDETDARLIVKEGAGYAILVLGRLDQTAEGHDAHAKTTDYVYRTLVDRAFDPTDIYYMREYLGNEEESEDIDVADLSPTKDDVQYAIETWAYNAIFDSPATLYIIFADHGSVDKFHLWSSENSEDEDQYITPAELEGYISLLESTLEGSGVTDPEIVFVYGGCHSGSFIPMFSAANRVVVTSCASDEISYRGVDSDPTDGSDVRDGEFFLMELFRNAGAGRSLEESFELASDKTVEYTASKSNGALAEEPQHPLLDDNGDGVGTPGASLGAVGADGSRAESMILGLGSNAGNTVSWFTVSGPVSIDPGGEIPSPLFAETTGRALTAEDTAWIEVKTPAYDSGELADSEYAEFQKQAEMVGPIAPGSSESVGEEKVRFEWSQDDLDPYLSFDTSGIYKVYYFLKDGTTGQVSSYLVTNIYVSLADNQPPQAVTLAYPGEGAVLYSTIFFVWGESSDPDGDAITYRLEVCEDSGFASDVIVKDGIAGTVTQLTAADGIEDLTDYYWRVIPVDAYGASPSSNTVRSFSVNKANPDLQGLITGVVEDSATGDAIPGASVTLTPGSHPLTTSTTQGVYYFPNLSPGLYTVEASASGYSDESEAAYVPTGGHAEVNFALTLTLESNSPLCTAIADVSFDEDGSDTSIDLDDYVSDVDNTDAEQTWTYSGATNVTVSIDVSTYVVTLSAATDWYGEETITFTCTDPDQLWDSTDVDVTVDPVNDAPVCAAIPDVSFDEDGSDTSIDLDDYVSDVDDADAELSWTWSGPTHVTVSIDPATHVVTLGAVANWYGTETITFICTDPGGLSDSTQVEVTVKSVNDAPVCTVISAVSFNEDGSGVSIDLDDCVSDVDNTDTELSWTYSGATNVAVSISPVTHVVTIGAAANWYGTETVTLTCTDPGGLSHSAQVAVTVNPVNDAPVCMLIGLVHFDEDGSDTSIDLDDYVSDVDDADAELSWTWSGPTHVTVSIDPATHVVTLGAVANWYGTETITFTCTDPGGLSDSTDVVATVRSVNDTPWIDPPIPNLTVEKNVSLTYDLTSNEHDVEDSDAVLVWSVSDVDTSLFSAAVDPATDELTITPVVEAEGSDLIELTLHDREEGRVSQWVTVGVTADMDGDDMPDGWEQDHGLDPSRDDALEDPDEDGLTNLEEYGLHTNPQAEDTDDDGLSDGDEAHTYGCNPLSPDSDDDGLTDGVEVNTHRTDPNDPDTDNDELDDGAEVTMHGTDPLDDDSDDDGYSDGAEMLGNTDPTDPHDYPDCDPLGSPANIDASSGTYADHVSVSWDSVGGASSYALYRSTSDSFNEATLLGDNVASPLDDTSAECGQTYHYWVTATNVCGESAPGEPDTGYRACGPGRITGYVGDAETQAPISGATVKLCYSSGACTHKWGESDSSGRFEISGVDAGQYYLEIAKSGYTATRDPAGGTFQVGVGETEDRGTVYLEGVCEVSLALGRGGANPGEAVVVPVEIGSRAAGEAVIVSFDLRFDPDLLAIDTDFAFGGIEDGPATVAAGGGSGIKEQESGLYEVYVLFSDTPIPDGVLASVGFIIDQCAAAGTVIPVQIENPVAARRDATENVTAAYDGLVFATPPVAITDVSPNMCLVEGGTEVTITGTGFLPDQVCVLFGMDAGLNVEVISSETLTVETPTRAAGVVDVVCAILGIPYPEWCAVLPLGFTYIAPGASGDVNGDDITNAIDVQLTINEALSISTGYDCDINGDGFVNAIDVQLVINVALGIGI